MEIISLDENRVKVLDKCVLKQSDADEVECLSLAKNLVVNFEPFVIGDKRYVIDVPTVYDYDKGIITMERCFGNNLELTLRNMKQHNSGVGYTNELLSYFINNSFYWHDFAPRNIMINDKNIWIMDFERGLSTDFDLPLYLLNNVYEEYSAFLLPEERKYRLEDYVSDSSKTVNVSLLTSKRVIGICRRLYGDRDIITIKEYYDALNIILKAEEPFTLDGQIVYPLLELEEYLSENGREKYIEKVMRKNYGNS